MMYAGGPGGDFLNMGFGGPSQGLMGNVAQNPMAGLMGQSQGPRDSQGVPLSLYSPWNSNAVNPGMQHAPNLLQNLNQNTQGGPWSQLAYQMAGRPNQGPYASVATPQGIPDASVSSPSGVGALGGTALGLLGTLANNPSTAKNLGSLGSSAISKLGGLFGSGALDTAGIGSAASAAAAEMGASVAPAVSAGIANTAADVAAANSAWLAAQPAAASAASAAAPAAAAAAAPASAAPAAAGSLGLGLAGVGLAAAPAIYGASRNPVDLHKSYWQGMDKTLQAGKNDPQYWNTVSQLLGMQSQDPINAPEAQQMLDKYGVSFYQNPNVTQGAAVSRVGSRPTQRY